MIKEYNIRGIGNYLSHKCIIHAKVYCVKNNTMETLSISKFYHPSFYVFCNAYKIDNHV